MARQNGPFIFEMTVCGVSFYKRCGRGYVRMKSNLTAKRWKIDPAFEGSRQCAANMARSSVVAGQYYQTIPREQRYYPFYKRLVGIAQEMLCAGFSMQHVEKVLHFTVCRYLRKLAGNDSLKKPVPSSFAAATRSFKTLVFTQSPMPAASMAPARMAMAPLTGLPSYPSVITSGPLVFHWVTGILPRGRPCKIVMPPLTPSLNANSTVIPVVAGTPMSIPAIFPS